MEAPAAEGKNGLFGSFRWRGEPEGATAVGDPERRSSRQVGGWKALPRHLVRTLSKPGTSEARLARALGLLGRQAGAEQAIAWIIEPVGHRLVRAATWLAVPSLPVDGPTVERAESLAASIAASSESARAEISQETAAGGTTLVVFPLRAGPHVRGVAALVCLSQGPNPIPPTRILERLGAQIGLQLEHCRLAEHLECLSRAVEQCANLVIITDPTGRIEYVNPKFTRVTGYSAAEAVGKNPRILKSELGPAGEYQRLWQTITAGREWHGEFLNRRKDGTFYWAVASISPVRDQTGLITHFVAIQEDISSFKRIQHELLSAKSELERIVRRRTAELVESNKTLEREVADRRRTEEQLRRTGRAHQALSLCGQALIRAHDEQQLLDEICRTIVEAVGYRLCWVGFAEKDAACSVRPIAHAGYESDYLKTVNVTWADTPRGQGPAGRSIRNRETVVIRDAATDSRFAPWREEALKRGYSSVLGIPLLSGVDCLGSITIYAAEPDAFDEPEVQLLQQLASDLVYGLNTLRDRVRRERAEAALLAANAELEARVEARTADLTCANRVLREEISERERIESALRASEQRYRQLTEGTRDAIVVADQEGTIRLFNPAAQSTFGYGEDEVIGQPLTILMPEEYRSTHQAAVARYIRTRESHLVGHTVELHGRRKDGDVFPLEISLSAIELPDGIVLLGAIRDLTERQSMQAQIVQAEKLASLGLLSAGIAHEINNPLAFVSNNLAVLERDFRGLGQLLDILIEAIPSLDTSRPDLARRVAELSEEIDLTYVRENLGRILAATRQGARRVSDIVQNLRGFARLDQSIVDEIDIEDAISSCLDLLRSRVDQNRIEIRRERGGVPSLVCAGAQINQVLLNLLVNAVQAIEATQRSDGRILIRTALVNDLLEIEISDNGCGIPTEHRTKIFDPFFTTKPVGQGTGLGLAIAQGIVGEHGGRLEVESRVGAGTTFRIWLPRTSPMVTKPRKP